LICDCDFCQQRSGNVFVASAQFAEEQVVAISGETKCYNGLEVDGIGAPGVPDGINYRFCTTCGSALSWDYVWPFTGQRMVSIAVGNLVDSEFPIPTVELSVWPFTGQRRVSIAVGHAVDSELPIPTVELSTTSRHHWVLPVPGADQDPIA
jgi:hypothetical protein